MWASPWPLAPGAARPADRRDHVLPADRVLGVDHDVDRLQLALVRQALDHLRTPALLGLSRQNIAPDLPVQQHQLAVDRQCGALLRGVDAALEIGKPVSITFRRRGQAHRLVGLHAALQLHSAAERA